jgi:type II secretory pathway pseudopilin PulG
MLVVVGIIVVLVAALAPMLSKANKYAQRSRAAADLQAIAQALDAYRGEHRDYPRVGIRDGNPVSGAVLLCWALISPGPEIQDGNDGPGFRVRGNKGQVYGPYLLPNKFRVQNISSSADPAAKLPNDDQNCVILDYWDHPIYYCPATPDVSPSGNGGYIQDYGGAGPRPVYDHRYFIENTKPVLDLNVMQNLLGDTSKNGTIDNGETPVFSGPFILWSAGANGVFGIDPSSTTNQTDDVTNCLQ